jgi:uncharacterized membrane protein YdjX (TVP38/TMEM64 family)
MADADSGDDWESSGGEYQERDDGQDRFESELALQGANETWGAALETRDSRMPKVIRRYAWPVVCTASILALRTGGVGQSLTMSGFQRNFTWLESFFSSRPLAALMVYVSTYTLLVTFTLPGATMLTVAAGALFPQPAATLVATIGATFGASGCFLLTHSAFVPLLREMFHLDKQKGVTGLQRIDAEMPTVDANLGSNPPLCVATVHQDPIELARNLLGIKSFSSLVLSLTFVRIVPVLPFFAVNMAAALLDVPLRTFAFSTFLGSIPGSLLYTTAGKILGELLEDGMAGIDQQLLAFGGSELEMLDFIYQSLSQPEMWFSLAFCMAWVGILIHLKVRRGSVKSACDLVGLGANHSSTVAQGAKEVVCKYTCDMIGRARCHLRMLLEWTQVFPKAVSNVQQPPNVGSRTCNDAKPLPGSAVETVGKDSNTVEAIPRRQAIGLTAISGSRRRSARRTSLKRGGKSMEGTSVSKGGRHAQAYRREGSS